MLQTCVSVGLPLTLTLIAFASLAVKTVFQRSAFTAESTSLVAPVAMVYALGIPWFLCRDVVVRAFYAMGRGRVPAATSVVALTLNALLNAALSRRMPVPAIGLVLSTVLVSCMSVLVLYAALCRDFRYFQYFQTTASADEGAWEGGSGWRPFLVRTLLASGATALYCKALLQVVLPSGHSLILRLTPPFFPASLRWLLDAGLVGAAFASSWLVYFLAFSCTKPKAQTTAP